MSKIYRRQTLPSGGRKQKKNEKNRVRNTIINFRVSPIEKELIEARIAVTGLTKAEFFIQSCLYQAILVKGNIRSFTEIGRQLETIAEALLPAPDLANLDPGQAQTLKTILEILDRRFRQEDDQKERYVKHSPAGRR